ISRANRNLGTGLRRLTEAATSERVDSSLRRNGQQAFCKLSGMQTVAVYRTLARLCFMPKMHEGQITIRPEAQGLRALPKFDIFAAPADKGFVQSADGEEGFARNRYAASAFGILHNRFRRFVER